MPALWGSQQLPTEPNAAQRSNLPIVLKDVLRCKRTFFEMSYLGEAWQQQVAVKFPPP